jgi:Uma2 family endonuclease
VEVGTLVQFGWFGEPEGGTGVSTGTQKLITAEEFARMPDPEDGSRQELVEGAIETMPPPSSSHGRCCMRIGSRLENFIEANNLGHLLCNDSGVILEREPDTVRGPDLSFWTKERLPEVPAESWISIPPDLIVEVLSPSEVHRRINKKVHQYLKQNVRLLWVVLPEDHAVTVYRPGQHSVLLANSDILTGEDVLPGFSCPVHQLFP